MSRSIKAIFLAILFATGLHTTVYAQSAGGAVVLEITPEQIAAACAQSDEACDAIIAQKIAQLQAPGRALTPVQIDAELAKVALAIVEVSRATPQARANTELRARVTAGLQLIEQAAQTPAFEATVAAVVLAVETNQDFQTAALQEQASGN